MDLEQLIHDHAHKMAAATAQIAAEAHSEEDVRHGVNTLIDAFLADAKIEVKGRHEYGLAGGAVDSKYGGVIIEYKAPRGAGRIGQSLEAPGTRALVTQIEQRFRDFRKAEGIDPKRIFAVGCDGNSFVFVRERGAKVEADAPQRVTPHTVARLLRALLSLGARGASFTPDQLAFVFGSDSHLARDGVQAIYAAIMNTEDPKALTFFSQWKILFGEVCGYDVEGKNAKIEKLGQHYQVPHAQPAPLLFSVHTYYAIFMKFLAAEITSSFSPLGVSVLKRCRAAVTSEALREEMSKLEHGGIWSQMGITNFLEGDLFSWYLSAWDERMERVVRGLVDAFDDFDPTTLSVEPAESRDLLKKLYQNLFPKSVRHDLGEYYTPDWLAEHVLNELGYDGDPDKRLLDPACGSGTFLVMAINRIRAWFEEHRHECGYREDELVKKVLSNIIGFDLNPLAVMAARTNYLMALRDLLRHAGQVELPVYLCDSIMTPAEYGALFTGERADRRTIKTSAGEFQIPTDVARNRETMGAYAEALEFCVRNGYEPDDFVAYCEKKGIAFEDAKLHCALYEQLRALDANNQNGIWARIIKNAFAPLFIGRVDYVAGNPPWVNWEHLPEQYREDTAKVWRLYDLAAHSGGEQFELGKQKRDLAVLFTYACMDGYLLPTGRLGFVITQTVFKAQGAEVFRKFEIRAREYIRCLHVDDLSAVRPFEGASNQTAVLVCSKGRRPTRYPVPYTVWRPLPGHKTAQDAPLAQVLGDVERRELAASPVAPSQPTSPWLTAPAGALPGIAKALGASAYQAGAGCCTWLNSAYWVRLLQSLPNGEVLIENRADVGQIGVPQVRVAVEPDLVFPLVRSQDIRRWQATPSAYIVYPHTAEGGWMPVDEGVMKARYPKTYAYLLQFKSQLLRRSGYRQLRPGQAFYILGNTNPANLSPVKVLWRQMLPELRMAVVLPLDDPHLGKRVPVTQHVVTQVSFETLAEAHYFAAVGNSSMATLVNSAYSTGKSYGTPHLLKFVQIPRYDPNSAVHAQLSALSQQAHAAASAGDRDTVAALEAEIDRAAAKLWGITDDELAGIQDALAEMDAPRGQHEEDDE